MSLQHSEVIRLDLPARHAYLHLLSETIAELLRQAGASNETLVYNIQLAAHEVCTNIVSHAYRNRQRNEDRVNVTLTFHPQPPCLEIELHDNGETFDPELVPQPNLSEAQIHGYGLFLIRHLMDRVIYTARSDGNYWHLVKYLEPGRPQL